MSLTARYKFGGSRRQAPASPKPQPSRKARNLALSYLLERLIEEGALENYAAAARRLGVSRARVSKICGLRWISPQVQEQILMGKGEIPPH